MDVKKKHASVTPLVEVVGNVFGYAEKLVAGVVMPAKAVLMMGEKKSDGEEDLAWGRVFEVGYLWVLLEETREDDCVTANNMFADPVVWPLADYHTLFILSLPCSEGHGNIKRSRISEFLDVEKRLLVWIKQTLDKNIPIDGPLLKQKSKDFATKLRIQNFSASNGWLEGFKKRNDINFKKSAGESKSVDQGVCNQWIEDLPSLLEGYDSNDIYNAHETALFFKCMPDKTFIFKGEKCHGGKQSKERLTILQCVNMTGTDKLPLLIIGKSKRLRCFKGVKTLPVDYASNTKAWMSKELFKDWQMKNNRKKIVLFIDNCTGPVCPYGKDGTVNTTSKLQPLDQGIIRTFKRIYHREVVKHTLTCFEENINPEINVLLAKFARRAWYTVCDVTVKNCFKHAGFSIGPAEQDFLTEQNKAEHEKELEVGPSNDEWAKLVYHDTTGNVSTQTFEDFVQTDDDVTTAGEYTDDDIVQNYVSTCIDGNDSEDEDRPSHILDTEVEDIKKKRDALKALETLHKF
ncbi:tigger transposable element-derived protein 4-like [Agrilus planipennis]|uniref:Tigger transposable element-derived protein 4-like n=1 Tax=Agrilus planipennis TaxID=224129 RepID=A0A7F5R0E5_AGRPL|nr:tigger transposable element-derived protein 4-like [Agrilus planipennis]